MTIGVSNISKDALRIANANRSQLASADNIRDSVSELRQITTRNADGVNATLTSTSGLANRARELGEIMDSIVSNNSLAANGNQAATTKGAKAGGGRRNRKSAGETQQSD
jgi:hypothetical protein